MSKFGEGVDNKHLHFCGGDVRYCGCPKEKGLNMKNIECISDRLYKDRSCGESDCEYCRLTYDRGINQVEEHCHKIENEKAAVEKILELTREECGLSESVNHPDHYKGNKYECIDIIEDYNLNFCLGNAIKYILRSDKKGNKNQDIEKAIWYLKREIE